MTPVFLLYALVVLALRVRWLLADRPIRAGGWLRKAGLESVVLVLAAPPVPTPAGWGPLGAALVTTLLANFVGWRLEQKGRWREGAQMLVGWSQLAVMSVWLGPWGAAELREPVRGWIFETLPATSALGGLVAMALRPASLLGLVGLLAATSEANLLLRWCLGKLELRPRLDARHPVEANAREFARGRIIGLLERALLFFFLLHGAYGAIGFTLAAKAATRFKDLDNRDFAEYVLIGTLLSSVLALAVGLVVRAAGGGPGS